MTMLLYHENPTTTWYHVLMQRPDWPEYFMNLAQVVATRGNCLLLQVGTVLVKDRRIIATGYNGTPMGLPNCTEDGCPRCAKKHKNLIKSGEEKGFCLCVHAEVNAILQSAYHGVSTRGSVLYATHSPCMLCAKEILNAGIIEVYYLHKDLGETESLQLLTQHLAKVQQVGHV